MVLKVKETENGQEVRFSMQQLIMIFTVFILPTIVFYTDYKVFRSEEEKKHEKIEYFNKATIKTFQDNNISVENYCEYINTLNKNK